MLTILTKAKNNHDTIQPGGWKQVRKKLYASITFRFFVKGCTANDRCPWDKFSSLHREDFGGSTGEGDTDASKENGGCIRTVVNPYKQNEPHEKLSYNTPLLVVMNPYKKIVAKRNGHNATVKDDTWLASEYIL